MKLTITTMSRIGIFFVFVMGGFAPVALAQFTFPGAPVPFTPVPAPVPAPAPGVTFTVDTEAASSCFQNDGSIVIDAAGGVVGEMGMGIVSTDCAEGTIQNMSQTARNVFALTLINPEAYCSRSFTVGDTFSYMIDVFNPDTNEWTEIFSVTTGNDCYYFPEQIEFEAQSSISAIRFRSDPDTNCGMQVQGLNYRFEAFGYQYSIDGGVTWGESNRFTDLAAGTYQVKIQDGVGEMSLVQDVIVEQAPVTTVDAGPDASIVEGGTAQLNASVNNLGDVFFGASVAPEEFCLFDAEGGDCSSFGTSICAEGYVWQYNDASQTATITSADLASVGNLELSVFYSCGDYTQPDGFNKWDLYVNGVLVGTTGESTSSGCDCEAAQFGTFPKTFTFDDFSLINGAWEVGGENNIEIVYSSRYNTGIALSAYRLKVVYGGVQTYAWSPAADLSAANIANPLATPNTTTTYTITYTDKFGCTATDDVTVNVESGPGTIPGPSPIPTPELIDAQSKDIVVSLGPDGTIDVSADSVDNGSTAVAGVASLSLSTSSFDCQSLGENDVELVVEDMLGRTEAVGATITVVDDTAPVITLNGDETIVHELFTPYSDMGAVVSDNCSATLDYTGTVPYMTEGTYTITYVAEDPSGNTSSATRTVQVVGDEDDDNDGILNGLDQYPRDPNNEGQPVLVSYVWDDLDGDGIQDETEPGIEGAVVHLLSGNSDVLASTTTNEEGLAAFFGLSEGFDYRLEFKRPEDYGNTRKNAGDDDTRDSDTNDKTTQFTVTSGINTQWDKGFTSPGEVQTYVWDDRNGDGVQDADEPPLKDIIVKLLGEDGSQLKQGRTNNAGLANLGQVPSDQKFRVQFMLPNGHAFTRANRGENDSKDSDARRRDGLTRKYKLSSGRARYEAIDAGMWTPGQVEAFLWDDRNGDGIQDGDEPGIKDVIVYVYDNEGNQVRQGRTNNAGVAKITKVPADKRLRLRFSDKANYGVTLRNQGTSETNSDIHRRSLQTRWFRMRMGNETVSRFDAGFWSPGTVEAFVWDDRNGDGVQDVGEPGVKDLIVEVYDKDGNRLKQGRTNNSGIATIRGIPADIPVRLQFPDKDGYRFTLRKRDDDQERDSDANRRSGMTRRLRAKQGAQLFASYDAGVWSPGTVNAYMWDDLNGDGIQDDNEPGIKDMIVHLLDKNGGHIKQARTNNAGIAKITGVPADERFRLQFPKADDESFTLRGQGIDTSKDSDVRPDGITRRYRMSMGAQVVNDVAAGIAMELAEEATPDTKEEDNVIDIETPTANLPPPRMFAFRTQELPDDMEVEELTMEVYPNPATERVFVTVANPVAENMKLTIMDMSGRSIAETELFIEVGVNSIEIDFGLIGAREGQLILRLESPSRGQLIKQLIKH